MAKGIRALLDTVMQALPQVGNLGLLFFLLFFIFAALGVELFGRLECDDDYPCQGLGEHAHFKNFGMAFLTLFRVATGDNWNGIMKDTLRDKCDSSPDCVKNCCLYPFVAPIFFVIFVLMAQFVLVNVVVAVLMKHLEESHKLPPDDRGKDGKSKTDGTDTSDNSLDMSTNEDSTQSAEELVNTSTEDIRSLDISVRLWDSTDNEICDKEKLCTLNEVSGETKNCIESCGLNKALTTAECKQSKYPSLIDKDNSDGDYIVGIKHTTNIISHLNENSTMCPDFSVDNESLKRTSSCCTLDTSPSKHEVHNENSTRKPLDFKESVGEQSAQGNCSVSVKTSSFYGPKFHTKKHKENENKSETYFKPYLYKIHTLEKSEIPPLSSQEIKFAASKRIISNISFAVNKNMDHESAAKENRSSCKNHDDGIKMFSVQLGLQNLKSQLCKLVHVKDNSQSNIKSVKSPTLQVAEHAIEMQVPECTKSTLKPTELSKFTDGGIWKHQREMEKCNISKNQCLNEILSDKPVIMSYETNREMEKAEAQEDSISLEAIRTGTRKKHSH